VSSTQLKKPIFLFLLFCGRGQADEALVGRFLKEYPTASRGLETRVATVRGSCTIRHQAKPASRRKSFTETAEFASDHGFRKVVTRSQPRGKDKGDGIVYCVGNGKGFSLRYKGDPPVYRVTRAGSDLFSVEAIYNTLFGRYLASPFFVGTRSMAAYMREPTFRVLTADEIISGTRKLVRVECRYGEDPSSTQFSLELDPSIGWAIRKAEFRSGPRKLTRASFEVEYQPLGQGTLGPKVVNYRDITGDTIVCEFDSIVTSPTDVHEFEMSYYGLPDLASPVGKQGATNARSQIFLAIAAIFVALATRLVYRRLRPRESPGSLN
jgi:hypothetical protein